MSNTKFKKFNINYILKYYFYIIIIIFLPLLFLVLFFSFVKPLYDEIETNTNFLVESQEKYNYLKYSQLEKIKELKVIIDSIKGADVEKINKILPDEKETESFIMNIESITDKMGISINSMSINVKPEVKTSKVSEVEIILNIKTNKIEKVSELLSNIEKNVRLQDVKSFYIQEDANTLINLTIYYTKTNE